MRWSDYPQIMLTKIKGPAATPVRGRVSMRISHFRIYRHVKDGRQPNITSQQFAGLWTYFNLLNEKNSPRARRIDFPLNL